MKLYPECMSECRDRPAGVGFLVQRWELRGGGACVARKTPAEIVSLASAE